MGNNPPGIVAVALGIGSILPTQLLSVKCGNINANTVTNGYMINNQYVLYHKGNISNMFGGVEAGLMNTGSLNTFFGYRAGRNNVEGEGNSFFGSDVSIAYQT